MIKLSCIFPLKFRCGSRYYIIEHCRVQYLLNTQNYHIEKNVGDHHSVVENESQIECKILLPSVSTKYDHQFILEWLICALKGYLSNVLSSSMPESFLLLTILNNKLTYVHITNNTSMEGKYFCTFEFVEVLYFSELHK